MSFARASAACGVVALALAAALYAGAFETSREGSTARVLLLDVSASVVRTRPSWRTWAQRELEREVDAVRATGEEIAVYAFARDFVRCYELGAPSGFDAAAALANCESVRDDASELDAALAGVMRAPELRRRRVAVVVFGDRSFTGRDPAARAAELDGGLRWVEPPPSELADAALIALRAPREIEAGAPLTVVAEVAVEAPELAGKLSVEVDAAGATQRSVSAPVALAPGERTASVRVELGRAGAGGTRIAARVRSEPRDPTPENDVAATFVASRGAIVVALDAASDGAFLSGIDGFAFAPVDRETFGDALARADVLLTLDRDPRELPAELVRDFVRRGGAWLACGGYEFLAGWGAARAGDLASELPLRVDDDGAERDVVLVVDSSGSMAGGALAAVREAAPELLAKARAADRVALRFFTSALEPEIELGRGGAGDEELARAAQRVLAARTPSGPTDVVRALNELARGRGADAQPMLALLWSDGRDAPAGAEVAAVRATLAGARIELAVIAAGAEADVAFLASLAGGPERLHRAANRAEIELAFASEAARGRVREDGPIELLAANGGGSAMARELREVFATSRPPDLDRVIRARARDGDEALLTTRAGEPVLALRPLGAGWTATATFAPTWSREPAASLAAMAPVLRALGRRRTEHARTRAELEGERLVLRDVPQDWPAVIEAHVLPASSTNGAPARASATLTPPTTGGGASPLSVRTGALSREATFDAAWLAVELSGADGWRAQLSCAARTSEEFALPRRELSAQLATADATRLREAGENPAAAWLAGFGTGALALGAALGAFARGRRGAGQARAAPVR